MDSAKILAGSAPNTEPQGSVLPLRCVSEQRARAPVKGPLNSQHSGDTEWARGQGPTTTAAGTKRGPASAAEEAAWCHNSHCVPWQGPPSGAAIFWGETQVQLAGGHEQRAQLGITWRGVHCRRACAVPHRRFL